MTADYFIVLSQGIQIDSLVMNTPGVDYEYEELHEYMIK